MLDPRVSVDGRKAAAVARKVVDALVATVDLVRSRYTTLHDFSKRGAGGCEHQRGDPG